MDVGVVLGGIAVVVAVVVGLGPRQPRWWVSGLGLLMFFGAGVWKLSSVRAAVVGPTVLRVETDRPVVALTFDDGPTVAYTKPILDLLEAERATATFFVVGSELAQNPELGRQILADGHELGNHSWHHHRMVFQSAERLRAEIDRTDALLRSVGVEGSIAFRPPYGKRLWSLHQALGARPAVLWDVEPETYAEVADDPERLAAHVLHEVRPGSIVLLHAMYGSREATRRALPVILAGLRARGLRTVTLGELLDGS